MDGVWLASPAAEIAPLLPRGGGIHLYNEGPVGVWMDEKQ